MTNLYKGKPVEGVNLDSVAGRQRALACTYDGARYHVWINPDDLGDAEAIKSKGRLYKNPPEGVSYRDAGSYPTRTMDLSAKFGSGLLSVMLAIAERSGALAAAVEKERKAKELEDTVRAERLALHRVKEAGPDLLAALKVMKATYENCSGLTEADTIAHRVADTAIAKAEGR